MNFDLCEGCYACVKRGEENCPVKDDRDVIIKEMQDADGLLLASPVYSHMVSAIMKNFFDRFGFYAHRPNFFDKYAMSIATCSGYGAEEAIKYMNKMLSVFGFNIVPSLELHVRPGKMPEENKRINHEKTIQAFDNFIARIMKGERDTPSLGTLIPFNIFKAISKLDKNVMQADFEYYKDKGDYYYDVKIPFYKKFVADRVTRKLLKEII